ncbi:ABC transporter permease [Dietzia sp. B32]|uniref:ABC transporter permease n=1 Tax=Dietzia sp. B32 TaxID=2915130 RepID=UPI0021AE0782|nr:ABC transporter permease [Dietzia sp. B32]UVE94186.1 ABC transporter permease [Dietzia sp. B32]
MTITETTPVAAVADQTTKSAAATPKRRRPSIVTVLAIAWLAIIISAAVLADVLPLSDPGAVGTAYRAEPGSAGAILGTDALGRDLLSRVVHGARLSLSVAFGATAVAAVVGTAIGLFAGYLRGGADFATEILTSTVLAFPPLILLIALAAALDPSVRMLVIGLAIVGVPSFVRVARAATIAHASREYVQAAHTLGASTLRIVTRELLPNIVRPALSFALVIAATLVVAEGSLSFLGLGVPPPAPSWGGMIAQGQNDLARAPFIVAVPGIAFFLTVYSLNTLGDELSARFGKGDR